MNKHTGNPIYIGNKEIMTYGIISININRIITSCNKSTVKLLNSSSDKIIGIKYCHILKQIPSIENFIDNKKPVLDSTIIKNKENDLVYTPLFSNKKEIVGTLRKMSSIGADSSFSLNNQSFQQVLDSSLDEVFITDGEGNVLFINAAAEELYGDTKENIINKNVLELEKKGYFSPSIFPIVKKRQEKVSMIQRTKMGKSHHVIAYPSFNEKSELINVVFNARDITEIKYLRQKIERSEVLIDTYKSELKDFYNFEENHNNFTSFAPNMLKIKKTINKVIPFDATILITGESGVGKGIITQEIHERGNRKNKPLVHINCGAIPGTLIESELFGYEDGAFTGAKKDGQKGLIEQADKGILFLDEVGEMPVHLQVKFLKVLQEREFRRIGGTKTIKVDIQIIAATNQDLNTLVKKGEFREDLFYRLNVIPIHIPPLRTRPEDITYLIDYFTQSFNEKYNLSKRLSLETENVLLNYNWPGNIRELENLMERLVITSEKDEIKVSDLPNHFIYQGSENNYAISVNNIITLKQAEEQMEEQLIRKAYEINTSSYKIANMLGINQSTAHRKINQYLKKNSK